jgi:hypothetical protein
MRKPVFAGWVTLILPAAFARRLRRLILLSNFCRPRRAPQNAPHDKATKSSELRHRNAADIQHFGYLTWLRQEALLPKNIPEPRRGVPNHIFGGTATACRKCF